ncbi:hypothetical protein BJV77DRAFT_1062687 [Russula vinacea]|nr:hypothetical protein BJV77DRAFT_1062687 [Russula vinacea]
MCRTGPGGSWRGRRRRAAEGVRPRTAEWIRGLVKGFKGGQALIRFVSAGGILLGLDDLKNKLGADPVSGSVRAKTEDELIIALTEIMEIYGAPKDSAGRRSFSQRLNMANSVDALSLCLLFAAEFLPHVFSERIKVLPLSVLSSHLMATIETTFASGSFLALLPSSCTLIPYDGPGPWRQSASLSGALKVLIGSPLFSAIPSFASITARILPLLTESSPPVGWNALETVVTRLEQLTSSVESDWAQSALAQVESEDDIASESREIAMNIWTVLKTLLFTTIMLLQSILSTVTYSRPVTSAQSLEHSPTHSSLALSTLRTLSHLSFVINKFGGVTSTSSDGFAELKRVFYSALDVLSVDVEAVKYFSSTGKPSPDPLTHARQAFNLACVEQLVPLLSLDTIEHCVFPLCLPHLNDASHRETYESAHSAILAVFAAQLGLTTAASDQGMGMSRPTFVEKIVPFYIRCLLENSVDGKLNTPQLRLAYSTLTNSASRDAPAMGQLCLSSLVSGAFVLVSTLSALPLVVLPDGLNAVSDAIRDSKDEERRMENMGDLEREYCLRWWEEQREAFEGNVETGMTKEGRRH